MATAPEETPLTEKSLKVKNKVKRLKNTKYGVIRIRILKLEPVEK